MQRDASAAPAHDWARTHNRVVYVGPAKTRSDLHPARKTGKYARLFSILAHSSAWSMHARSNHTSGSRPEMEEADEPRATILDVDPSRSIARSGGSMSEAPDLASAHRDSAAIFASALSLQAVCRESRAGLRSAAANGTGGPGSVRRHSQCERKASHAPRAHGRDLA
jgi:hypothetical protein